MRNKYKLTIVVIAIIIIGGGFYFQEQITGFVANYNFGAGETNPATQNYESILLNSSNTPVQIAEDEWTIMQKYQVGKNDFCIKDCVTFAAQNGFEYYRAYSQKWGTCMCKYSVPD